MSALDKSAWPNELIRESERASGKKKHYMGYRDRKEFQEFTPQTCLLNINRKAQETSMRRSQQQLINSFHLIIHFQMQDFGTVFRSTTTQRHQTFS